MNEEDRMGKEVATLLNRSLGDIDQHTLHRLQAARRAALENYQPEKKIFHVGVGISAHSGEGWFFAHANKLFLSIAVLLILTGSLHWKANYEIDESAAIDTMLLADDLPIDVYLDDEFDLWLDSTR
ncbi:DUF3619 family protein [Nitrosomonas sp. Is37]|uniref:DUF3619 family protein n=1 Tax=Nitrosomonas sp. Is37 TaxID=3080535 RepID=UPI00294B4378|nr:DUF3619 family protein [Nitrosomonas sp. Is37]MDV6343204.1 DUF3619 family protein [Nitrosomonas sp. Is37]